MRSPFRLVEMTAREMRDLSAIEKRFVKKKKCEDGSILMMRTLYVVRVTRDHPSTLFFEYNYNRDVELWSSINIGRRARRGAPQPPPLDHSTLPAVK